LYAKITFFPRFSLIFSWNFGTFVYSFHEYTILLVSLQKMLYKFLYALYNTQVNTKKHYEGDSMYPQLARRESGFGANPMTRKIQKITPEWQSEPFFCSVGSAVARVKGKHHDGDAAKLDGGFCRQFRWYRELFRPVGMKGFFYIDNQ
jgi:hypothetical protein